MGVKVEMAERGGVEETVENSWYQRSPGLIDISEGPIRWINILNRDGGKSGSPRWWIVLGVSDERSTLSRQQIKIKTVRKKTFPLFGKVVNIIWRGFDRGTGLMNRLSKDGPSETLAKRIDNLEIKSEVKGFQGRTLTLDRRFSSTSQDWETVEKIADYILSPPRSL